MRSNIILLGLGSLLLTNCDYIAPEDQLIEVGDVEIEVPNEENSAARKVLLEDFTGQLCANCPEGTEVIEQLHEAYGERFIAVGIHGGPLGFKSKNNYLGLFTQLGDDYYNHWGLEFQPVGLIDRGAATNYTDWTRAVRDELSSESGTRLELNAQCTEQGIDISVAAERLAEGSYQGNLQLWVLEDSIVAMQTMPDGSRKLDYVHNHVLRTAVNGAWGDVISLQPSEKRSWQYHQPVATDWDVKHLSIVAFLYNDEGVEQAEKQLVSVEKYP